MTVVVAMLCSACQMGDDETMVIEHVKVGSQLPAFIVSLDNGRQISTDDLMGRTSVIVFFSTRCADCLQALPELERFYREVNAASGGRVEVFAISRGEEAPAVEACWRQLSLSLPYSAQPTRSVYELFATAGVPRIYVANPLGTVVAAYDDTNIPTAEVLHSVVDAIEMPISFLVPQVQ